MQLNYRCNRQSRPASAAQSPAFGTGSPGGDKDREWQRWLRCRAAAPECRDFLHTCQPRRCGAFSGRRIGCPRAWYTSPAFGTGGPGGEKPRSAALFARCGLQQRHATESRAFSHLPAAAVGAFSGRRIGCPRAWYTIRPWQREESRLFACGFRAGTPRKKPGFAKPGIWDRQPGW